jgi:anti-anti-sigma factor
MSPTDHSWHQVYPYEMHGNTLVVRPRGDCVGFALHQVRREMGEIHTLAEQERVVHLLIDLSAEHYFGSMVLGDLVEFGQTVKARGGRIGLCGASNDFLAVLKLMHLDAQWDIFPDTATGLQTVATIPWREQVWAYRYVAAALTAVCLMLGVITYWPRPDRGPELARQLVALWENHHRLEGIITTEEQQLREQKLQARLEPIVHELLRIARRRSLTALEYSVLHTAQPWMGSMRRNSQEAQAYYGEAVTYLEITHQLLGDRTIALAAVPLMDISPPRTDPPQDDPPSAAHAADGDSPPLRAYDPGAAQGETSLDVSTSTSAN